LHLQHGSLIQTIGLAKKVNSFTRHSKYERFIQSLTSILYHSSAPHFSPYVSDKSIGEFRLAYETYHTRILFFERYVRTLTCSILAYRTRILAPWSQVHNGRTSQIT